MSSDTTVETTPAPAAPRPHRPAWPARVVLVLASVWTLFVLLNLLLSGRWWPWLVFSLVPPLAYPIGCLTLLAGGLVRRLRTRASAAVSLAGLVLALPQAGLLPQALWHRAPHTGERVRVVAWNTEYWHQGEDPGAFYSRLRGLGADVYLLSEYLGDDGGRVVAIDDRAALDRAFPGYHIVIKGQLVTVSRLPVVGVPSTTDQDLLRVDLATPRGVRFSTYNVHVPAQLDPTASPLSGRFWATLRQRARDRAHTYRAVRGSAGADTSPGVIAGDLNTTASMGDLRKAAGLGADAALAGGSAVPLSWNAHHPIRLWRLDWMFTRDGLSARHYRLLDPWGTSDHRVQLMDAVVEERS
ncbi:endonuclease/exonuclease/phosphatase family protein [Actinoallomurus acaciae]|uniref:Endonuclease/exonuclease/phosphatase family protein n=1 Tax=Actinoallomurus acaciae TaxID=502577 RepID=A0ABV5YQE5_9ACTN